MEALHHSGQHVAGASRELLSFTPIPERNAVGNATLLRLNIVQPHLQILNIRLNGGPPARAGLQILNVFCIVLPPPAPGLHN